MRSSRKTLLISALAIAISLALFLSLIYNFEPKNPQKIFPTAQGTNDTFRLTMTLDETNYTLGDSVNMTFMLTNMGNQTKEVILGGDGFGFSFRVYDNKHNTVYPMSTPISPQNISQIEMTSPLSPVNCLMQNRAIQTNSVGKESPSQARITL
jgi:hypothetical protein